MSFWCVCSRYERQDDSDFIPYARQVSAHVVRSFPAAPFGILWIIHDLIPEGVISMLAEVVMAMFDFHKPRAPCFLA